VSDHSFQISPDVVGAKAKRLNTLPACPSITPLVTARAISELMGESVHLDGNSSRPAEEIEHKRPKRMLPSKLQSVGPLLQHSPETNLRRTHAFAKLTRLID
jgi:hypothetical protein